MSQKKGAVQFCRKVCQILIDFQNSFIAGKSMKFPTKTVQKFSTYFNNIVTLSRETLVLTSVSYRHRNRICWKYSDLTCMQSHRCVCHSLIAKRVLYLSTGQRSHIQSQRHCLVSGAGNTRVHITTSLSPNLNLVAYTICGIIKSMSTSCVLKMLMNWKKRQLVVWYSTEHYWQCSNNEWCISQGSVATPSRSVGNFVQVSMKISSSFLQWNNFTNRLIFRKVIAKILGHLFFWDTYTLL